MAYLDFDMTGVKPAGEYQELSIGQYLARIEDTEKKGTKDRFNEDGTPSPDNGKNFYLQISLKVYGGASDGHVEFERLNLWNGNKTAVDIARSQLKSIQNATGIFTAKSEDLHGRWLVLEVKAQRNGQLAKHYSAADVTIIPQDVPPVEVAKPSVASVASVAAAASAPAAASNVPSWAQKKQA